MKKFFLFLTLVSMALGINAQDINKYLYPYEELQVLDPRRSDMCLTMINSIGHTMCNGDICTLKELPALIEADVAKKSYMVIIADVPKEHATFQAVARIYLSAALKAHKKPIKIYYGNRGAMQTPPPPPAVEIEIISE